MGLLADSDADAPTNVTVRTWRVTTAVRAFALALCIGMLLANRQGDVANTSQLTLALVLVAGVCSALEWGTLWRSTAWIPVGEALLVSLILTSSNAPAALFAYLVVPPVVSGVRHGLVTVLNATFIGALTLILTVANSSTELSVGAALPWLVLGLGGGILASWQSRATRDLHARQAPYAAAHQLMSQLHTLAREGAVGLDSTALADALATKLRSVSGAIDSAIFAVSRGGGLHQLTSHGESSKLAEQVMSPETDRRPDVAVVSLRGVEEVRGFAALARMRHWDDETALQAAELGREFALRLDTAVLFEDIRHMATSEERNRIAREMHDGVAQELVALGYLVDEIDSMTTDPTTKQVVATLREEVSRVVTELRYSIFDLRQQVNDNRLAVALAEYVREVSKDSDLRVHLMLEESESPGPKTESEILRIAQEAVGNVRRHSRAKNLWVTYSCDGSSLGLTIEDDGVGNATPKERHWGLQTMKERAFSIGAQLDVSERPGGGTTVRLHSGTPANMERISR